MDPERSYLRLHARLSGMLSQLLTPRTRTAVENACLAVSFALLCLLIVMHANFVQQPGCSGELSEISNTQAQLVQIKITGISLWTWSPIKEDTVDIGKKTGSESFKIPATDVGGFTALPTNFWSDWLGSSAKRRRLIFNSWMSDKQIIETRVDKTPKNGVSKSVYDMDTKADSGSLHVQRRISIKKFLKESVLHFYIKWSMPVIWVWNTGMDLVKCDSQLQSGGLRIKAMCLSLHIYTLQRRDISCFQKKQKRSTTYKQLISQYLLRSLVSEIGNQHPPLRLKQKHAAGDDCHSVTTT